MRKPKEAAIGFIFITLLIDVMGIGLIIPVMPELIATLKGIPINEASKEGGYLMAAYALMQFLFAPMIGNLSDKYGRRPILLCSLLGFGIDYIILALAPTYAWLFVGRLLAGFTGASFSTAAAYIADVSTPENRAKNFGMIGAAFGLGFIIGPALGGLVAGWGIRAPFYFAAALSTINFLYGYFVLPESLSKENRKPFKWARANPIGSLKLFTKYKIVGGLAIAFFFLHFAGQAVHSNWSFYTMHLFKWSEKEVGFSLAIVGLMIGLVQAVLIRYTEPRLGTQKSIYLGFGFYALGLGLFAFANQSWMMYTFLIPYCLGGICGPSLQSLLASQVKPSDQGELQGSLTSIMSLTAILGPIVMNNLFYVFSKNTAPIQFPGIPFFLGALLILLSIYVCSRVFKRLPADYK